MKKKSFCFFWCQLLLFVPLFGGCVSSSRDRSDHFDGKRFFNLFGVEAEKSFSDLIKWNVTETRASWPEKVENQFQPDFELIANPSRKVGDVTVTLVNHVTFLIQVAGKNLITDPVFSERASPLSFLGPKRVHPPGLTIAQLPTIDFVLVSHNHYDHMDVESLKEIEKRFHPLFILPLANQQFLPFVPKERIVELDWWQSHTVSEAMKITLSPAQHWSARTPFDKRESLWGAFVIEAQERRIYFAGDTGYGPHFNLTRERLGEMHLSFLPIGAYEPRWFMKESHMNPEDAVLAHQDLKSQLSIGMHFGTFQLTNEAIDQPLIDLKTALEKHQAKNFITIGVGQTRNFKIGP